MIAARIAPDLRTLVVGSPAYSGRAPLLMTPQDLQHHDCIAMRLPAHGGLLCWNFARSNRTVVFHPTGRLVFNRSDLIVWAALAGHGLAWLPEDLVRPHLDAGRLVTALDAWTMTYPGYHLYYAGRRSSPALAHVVAALREGFDAGRGDVASTIASTR